MVVYADIYILINFVCNLISLLLCAAVTSSKIAYTRFILSSSGMALYSFFVLILCTNPFLRIPLDLTALVIGIRTAFGKTHISFLIKASIIFFFACVVIGGIVGLFSGLTCFRAVMVIVFTPIIYFAWYLFIKGAKHSEKSVSVVIDGKKLSGLSDSGNMLYDTQRGMHMIVVKAEKLNVDEKMFSGWIKAETLCGTGYMPYYYPSCVEVENRKVNAAVALNGNKELKYDCIVPDELT